ncbi:MAG: DUF92 domain-containing protein [Gemmatimonadales bacterium]
MTSDDPHAVLGRLLLGLAAAAMVAAAAYRAGTLTAQGAAAATVVGGASVAGGWDWGAVLIAFFVASAALSRMGHARKELLGGGLVAKGGPRDAVQVLANGGAFALCAIAYALQRSPVWYAAGAGGLAAATADTWGTEIGMLSASTPRSIVSGRVVPPGTSGGITGAGTLASVAGALFIAIAARAIGWPMAAAWSALIGGFAGATADSILGATLQARWWCGRCQAATERLVHSCGTPSTEAGGLAWLGNDAVNVAATITGALVGLGTALATGQRVS